MNPKHIAQRLLDNSSKLVKKKSVILTLAALASGGANAQIGGVLWEDNFNSIDTAKWNVDTGDGCQYGGNMCGWGNQELQWYSENNATIEAVPGEPGNNALVLRARREAVGGKEFTSGKLTSQDKTAFKYGMLEIRARTPNLETGLWPAIWMLGTSTLPWPNKGEIDIMEMGHQRAFREGWLNYTDDWNNGVPGLNSFTGSNLIFYNENACVEGNPTCAAMTAYQADNSYNAQQPLNDRFVKYRLYWTPEYMRFTIVDNGVEHSMYPNDFIMNEDFKAFQEPFYMLLNLAVGGTFTDALAPGQVNASMPAPMYIDYVRLHQLDGYGEVIQGSTATPEGGTFGVFTDNSATDNKLVAGSSADIYLWDANSSAGNIAPYEGSEVIAYSFNNANNWFGAGIQTYQARDMSSFADNGFLKFKIKIPGDVSFRIGVTDTYTNENWITFPAGQTKYGLVRNGEWGEVSIPVNDVRGQMIALQSMQYMFAITSDPAALPNRTFQYAIDDILWTGGGAVTPQPTVNPTPTVEPTPTPPPSGSFGVRNATADSAEIYVMSDDWADLHYTINGGTQLNVRMSLTGNGNVYLVQGLNPGDEISYNFTYWNGDYAVVTEWVNYTHSGGTSSSSSSSSGSTSSTSSSGGSSSSSSSSSGGSVSGTDITNLGGTISAQFTDSPAAEQIPNIIDNDTGSKYLTFNLSGWVQYDAPASYIVTGYTITSANDAPERDPTNWTLQGSNDGNTWTTIDTRSGEDFANRFETRAFTFANNQAFTSYRLNLTGNSGNILQVAEIELFGEQYNGGGNGGGDNGGNNSNGSGLTASYFKGMNFDEYVFSRVDGALDFNWGGGSPDGSIPNDQFSAVWSGQIEPRYSDTYTFHITSDNGRRVYVDGQLIIDKWVDDWDIEYTGSINLVAGQKYDIRVEYFENNGGANMKLEWSSNMQSREIIPASQLFPEGGNGLGNGLRGHYYNGMNFDTYVASRTDATLDMNWNNGSPINGVNNDRYSARWEGKVVPRFSGDYTFFIRSDNGRRVWVNGQLVVDKWIDDWDIWYQGSIALQANHYYDIVVEYFENNGGANIKLEWESNQQARQVVPQSQLYSSSANDPVSSGPVTPLYNANTQLEPDAQWETAEALHTRFSDRPRTRHAKEDQFQSYDHYIKFYFEHRSSNIEIIDRVAKGGDSITMNVRTLWALDDTEAENRWWYIGRNTVAHYVGNGTMQYLGYWDGYHHYTKTDNVNRQYNRPIQIGDRLEFEISQFSRSDIPRGQANYYGTTFLYMVGEGLVPWYTENTGEFVAGAADFQEDSRRLPEEYWLGGKHSTLHYQYTDEPDNHFMQMATYLGYDNAQKFLEGRRVHHSSAIDGTHDEDPENGVFDGMPGLAGTRYINERCSDCHERNGTAPVVANGQSLDAWVFKVGDANGNPHPELGSVLQPHGSAGEGSVVIANWSESNGLRTPNFQFSGVTPERFSARLAPRLVGLGLLEAIPEETILAMEDPNDANGDGISGRAQRVPDPQNPNITRLGRFGWKASTTSVAHQVAAAFNTDMGVRTSMMPNPDCGSNQGNCGNNSPILSDEKFNNLVVYLSTLGVRPQRGLESGYRDTYIDHGKQKFRDVGCTGCHTETVQTSRFAPHTEVRDQTIHPYTDMLLHDMGPGLADNLGEYGASGSEWRTTPLWGLGLSACVTGGLTNPSGREGGEICTPHHGYLHDGRARSIEEAILWHGGEGEASKNAFRSLNSYDKQAVLRFLEAL